MLGDKGMREAVVTPKVFISYSWTNEEHKEWVLRLAERLVSDGVDVVIDRWHLKEGQDKYVFMEQMVTNPEVTRVLAICDKKYAQKADARAGGVGTESQILSPELYAQVNQEKIIPLVREWKDDGVKEPYLPVFFKGRMYIDFSNDATFEESHEQLLRNIFARPERKKPPLGVPPAHLFIEDAVHVKTAGKLQRLKDAVERGKPNTQAMLQDYLDVFLESLENFRVEFHRNPKEPFDQTVRNSIHSFGPYRDNFIDFILFIAAYMNENETYERLLEFLQEAIPYQSRPAAAQSHYEGSTDNYRFILTELFLYMIAGLVRAKRSAAASRFIEAEYHFTKTLGGSQYTQAGISALNETVRSLSRMDGDRVQMDWSYEVAKLFAQRATHPPVTFRDIFQMDLILFFRPFFPNPGAAGHWFPRCLYHAREQGTVSLFAKSA
jgi:TIR domain